MNQLVMEAKAKINLSLDVLGKRADGYHEVRMIMQSLDLCDTVTVTKSEADGITLTSNLNFIPTDERNLAYKAARMMIEEFQIKEGVTIDLVKRIPVAAGMAGGSTDGAAVLVAMSRLFDLSLTDSQLMERGVRLGADVPYCIMGGTALSEGIGEVLSPLPPMPECYFVIAKPGVSVSTKYVYEQIDSVGVNEHPDTDGMIHAIREGSLDGVSSRLCNVLEAVTITVHPEIQEIKTFLKEQGAKNALMSGSGPTVFGIFQEKDAAKRAADKLKKTGLAKQIFVARPV